MALIIVPPQQQPPIRSPSSQAVSKETAVSDAAKKNVFVNFQGKIYCFHLDPINLTLDALQHQVLRKASLWDYHHHADHGTMDLFWTLGCCKPLPHTSMTLQEVVAFGTGNSNPTLYLHTRQRGGCFMISLSILAIIVAACIGSVCTCGCSLLIIPVLLPFLFVLPLFCL